MKEKSSNVQIIRALCIIAVVSIHTCPSGQIGIILRPFLNFCVSIFIFLSGYLTKIPIENNSQFIKRRTLRIIFPYIIWSVIYTIIYNDYNNFILKFLTARCCGIYYYLFVYIQLVLITPIIVSMINKQHKYLIYSITPIFILILYILNISGYQVPFPLNAIFCPMWISYYAMGLMIGNKKNTIQLSLRSSLILYFIGIFLQLIEGELWNYFNNYNMATTQIRLSNFITNIGIIFIISNLINKEFKFNKTIHKILVTLGDYSFGIYLTHMILVSILNKILNNIIDISFPITTISILIIEYFGISICYKIFNDKILKTIGLK
jgi:surface polysaccharide O-acyltransferase-like enzyme